MQLEVVNGRNVPRCCHSLNSQQTSSLRPTCEFTAFTTNVGFYGARLGPQTPVEIWWQDEARGGRCMDNIFIERLWRSLKQEAVYLEDLTDGFKAHRVIRDWMTFYNTERPHSALEHKTPKEAYWADRNLKLAA